MELKGRLGLIAKKVPNCDIVTDVGTDHAYIPIFLIKNSICKKAIATDIKKGPIMIARNNISSFDVDGFIEARIGYGLELIDESESDVIIIAGMGGILIKDILIKDLNKAVKAKTLVLQPMNAIEVLREWLYSNGFEIYDEEMCSEGEKLYNVIVARWTGKVQNVYRIDYYIGKKLIEKQDPLLGRYIGKKIKQLEKSILEMNNSSESRLEAKENQLWFKGELERILKEI